ncbi:MAG: SpoIIE family protein phosphatase [Candidatus Riflebacteria bacterium]|nr:SpoIIE family protein phosphatase [Candidatus Riflebacteria bacterium]
MISTGSVNTESHASTTLPENSSVKGLANTFFKLLTRLAFCFIFFGIPLLLFVYEIDQMLRVEQRIGHMRLVRRLDRMIPTKIAERVDTSSALSEFLIRAWMKCPFTGSSSETFEPIIREVKSKFQKNIELVCIDENGSAVASCSDFLPPPDLLRAFHRDYMNSIRGNPVPLKQNIDQYRSFLGPLVGRQQEVNLNGSCVISSYLASRTSLLVSLPLRKRFFLAFFSKTPDWENIGYHNFANGMMFIHPELGCAVIDITTSFDRQNLPWGGASKNLGMVLARLGDHSRRFTVLGGRVWTQVPISPTIRAVFALRDEAATGLHSIFLAVRCVALLIFSCISGATLWFIGSHHSKSLSIRWKLFLLFLYVVGIPLALLGISTRGYLRERRMVLESRVLDDLVAKVGEFDRRFREYLGIMEMHLQAALSVPTATPESLLLDTTRKHMRNVMRQYKPAICEIVDENGNSLFHGRSDWDAISKRFLTLINGGAASLIKNINHTQETNVTKIKDQFLNMTAEFFGINVELVFSIFTENIGTLRDLSLSRSYISSIFTLIRDKNMKVRYLCIVAWPIERLAYAYLRTQLIDEYVTDESIHIGAYNSNDVWIGYPQLAVQAKIIANRVIDQPLPVKFRCRIGNRSGLMIGMKGNALRRHLLYAFADDAGIRRELSTLASRNLLLSMAILSIAFAVGRLLARSFLEPIGNLSIGLEALVQRNFQMRVTITANDELGDLSRAFNEMLEGLEDLEVAKVVQENFFPASPISLGPWNISGSCLSASRVGGDYFDYFILDERRLAIIIGDVSGHGASAALVVAMAKALIAHPMTAPGGDFDPAKVLEVLHKVFSSTLKQKKMMTCLMAVFDTDSGLLRIASAGHNYPFLISDGTASHIELQGMPLGIRTLRKISTMELHLKAEDAVLFYTDGFIEALDLNGEMIGYKRVAQMLPGVFNDMRDKDAVHTEKALRTWHDTVAMPGPIADDITLVVLKNIGCNDGSA